MKPENQTSDSRGTFQTQALERREECNEIISRAAVRLGIHDPMLVLSAFTEVFMALARYPQPGRELPMSMVKTIAERFLLRHQKREERRRERERQYVCLRPETACMVEGVCVDDVDFGRVRKTLLEESNLRAGYPPLAGELAVEIAGYAEEERRTPTQSYLASALGVSQATVSRLLPAAFAILRQTIETLQG